MAREKKADKFVRALAVAERMNSHYGETACALHYTTPFTLTIAVLLSAQAMAQADPEDIARIIRSIGFYRTKAKNCIACAQMIMSDFGGEVPRDMDQMQKLPGVGRKTANVVLNEAFGIVEGIAVDTHVFRIAHKLKFAGPSADTPAKTEEALLSLYPREYWGPINHQWVLFGRETCIARRPKCADCFISDLCPSCPKDLIGNRGNPQE